MNIPYTTRAGLALGAVGVLVLSPDALLLRLFGGDNFALASGRGMTIVVFVAILVLFTPALRSGFRWRLILLYGIAYSVGLVSFPMSVRHTHVANTVVILAVAPLLSAVGARIFLGEHVPRRTWLACAASAAGLALVFAPQLAAGKVAGDLWALLTALSLAACAIIIRRYPETNLFPGIIFGGIIAAAVYAPFAEWNLPARDIGILVANGLLVTVAFLCIMAASRRLSPPEINLMFLLETAAAPLWVWLALGEEPPVTTVIAGVFIIAILAVHSRAAWREQRMSNISSQ